MSLVYDSSLVYDAPYAYDAPSAGTGQYFFPPQVQDEPPYLPDSTPLQIGLWRHYAPGVRGVNVFLLSNGTYVQDTATPENSDTNIPYPINFNNPGAPFVYITNFDGTTESFYQDPYVVKEYFGGTYNPVSAEEIEALTAAGYGSFIVNPPATGLAPTP